MSTDDLEEQIVAFEDYVRFVVVHVVLLRMMKLFYFVVDS